MDERKYIREEILKDVKRRVKQIEDLVVETDKFPKEWVGHGGDIKDLLYSRLSGVYRTLGIIQSELEDIHP